jgi:hypothetical protein
MMAATHQRYKNKRFIMLWDKVKNQVQRVSKIIGGFFLLGSAFPLFIVPIPGIVPMVVLWALILLAAEFTWAKNMLAWVKSIRLPVLTLHLLPIRKKKCPSEIKGMLPPPKL